MCLLFIHPRAPNGNHSTYLKTSLLVAVYGASASKCWWLPRNPFSCCLGAQLAISVHNCPVLADTRFPMSIFKRTQRKYVKKAISREELA